MEQIHIKLPKLLPYQSNLLTVIDDPTTKYLTVLKSRQVGMSFFSRCLIIKWAFEDPGCTIIYAVPTNKLGKRFYRDLIKAAEPLIANKNSIDLLVEFSNGSSVQFLSAESQVRGFNQDYLIIDEAAFMSDEFFDEAIKPSLLVRGKKVIIFSTPFLSQGFFHRYYNLGFEDSNTYKNFFINIFSNPMVSKDEIDEIKKVIPDRVWKQEYLAEFLDGQGIVFTNFRQCINNTPDKRQEDIYYAAIDWGKTDSTVLTVMNQRKEVVDIYRLTNLDYTLQIKLLAEHLNLWKPKVVVCEENSMGTVCIELLKKAVPYKIKAVTLTNSLKIELVEALIVAFESSSITILDNPILLNELSIFSCEYNPKTQNIYYGAKSPLHDDTVCSLFYCLYAASSKAGNYNVI